ncbi:MAG: DUF1553 domain-containing protein [Verrucomicrobia bacterium]|nr:DUF1553 domain-containing protein [Verrucomicrobiota bacterium]
MMNILLAVGVVFAVALGEAASPTARPTSVRTALATVPKPSPFETQADLTPRCPIDQLVFAKFKQFGIQPANLSSDATFLRRAYLDVIGTLPTPREAREFLNNKGPDKRGALIERLLTRDEFADYWANKWSDLLRVKAEFPINLWPRAAQAYHQWIWASIKSAKPYDRFVRELLTANGSNFRDPAVNFYRAMQNKDPQSIAQAVALTFMGTRSDKWPKETLAGMAAFFSQIGYKETSEWKEEIVFFDPDRIAAKNTNVVFQAAPVFPDGTAAKLSADHDPREVFADWLTKPTNPWFTRAIANRVWFWLLGRGIIHEPDDIRADNPTTNPELLEYLCQELINAHYDLKQLFRVILNSKTYQLSFIAKDARPEADAFFSHYLIRRLDAEVLADALNQVTGMPEHYTSAIPEPFTFIPEKQRSISLPDGSIGSPFLELFGRPPRDTGLESERNNRPTADQRLHLLNSSHVQKKIEESPKIQYIIRNAKRSGDAVTWLYLLILSRHPTPEEWQAVTAHSKAGVKDHEVAVDLAWALINSAEFLYRH